MPPGATANFFDGASFTQCMVEGISQRIADKPERIKEIAFPRPVCPDQKHEAIQLNVTGCDAFVVLKDDTMDKGGVHR
jgi:hypothetical protein